MPVESKANILYLNVNVSGNVLLLSEFETPDTDIYLYHWLVRTAAGDDSSFNLARCTCILYWWFTNINNRDGKTHALLQLLVSEEHNNKKWGTRKS